MRIPEFPDNRHIKVVKLSALCTDRHYPQEIFLVPISVRGRVDPGVIVQLRRIRSMKNRSDSHRIKDKVIAVPFKWENVIQSDFKLAITKML